MTALGNLLLDERPVVVQPSLVRLYGIAAAAILQQLHYWSKRSTNLHDGHAWVYKTYQDWSDETGMSPKAVRGALDRLRSEHVVVDIESPTDPRDRTRWWRIDRDALTASTEGGRPSAPEGRPSAPEASSYARATDAVHREQTEIEGEGERARAPYAGKIDPQPTGDPTVDDVVRILRDAPRVWFDPLQAGIAGTIAAFPTVDHRQAAHVAVANLADPAYQSRYDTIEAGRALRYAITELEKSGVNGKASPTKDGERRRGAPPKPPKVKRYTREDTVDD
jgi:hypothetical protein